MRWKWIFGVLAVVVVVAVVVIGVILAAYDYNKLKPLITDAAREYTGRKLTMKGDVGLALGLPPSLEVKDIAFQNAPWGSQPQMAQLKKLRIQVAIIPLIRGDLAVKQLILEKPVFLLEIGQNGKSNLDFDVAPRKKGTPRIEEKSGDEITTELSLEEVDITDAQITYKDHRSGQTHAVEIKRLVLRKPVLGSGADITITGSYNRAPIEVEGNIGLISKALNSSEKWPLKLHARALETKIAVEGSILDLKAFRGVELKLDMEGQDLANFEKLGGQPLPVTGPFRVAGQFTSPSHEVVKVSDLLIELGESQIQGSVSVTHTAKRPRIEAQLGSSQLDLRPVMADDRATGGSTSQAAAAESKKDKVFPNTPLQLDGLNSVDALVQLKAARILLPHWAFEDFMLDMSLESGVLNIKQLNAGGEKVGKLAGTMELDAKNAAKRINLKLDIDDLDLGHMAKNLELSDTFAGKLNFDLELRGQGESIASIMAGLNGDSRILMSDGRIDSRYAETIFGDLRASLTKLFNPMAEEEAYTTLNCLVNHFEIKDGLAESRILVVDTNRMTVVGDGDINLKTEALDIGITPEPKEGLGAEKVGKVHVSLSEFSKPFRLQGTLANPSLGIDPAETALSFGKALGNIALFGPAGLATTFVSGKFGENHPCTQSLAALDQKGKPARKKESGGIGSKIKNLFK